MKYTLRQLQIFLAVAKYQNISKAAASLHMSQSAASESLMNLEHSYDIKLFDRAKKKLELNAVGRTLRAEAERLITQCIQFEHSLKGHKTLGHLRVGASFTIGNHLATRYLADYLSEYPQADVELAIANSPEVVKRVLDYEIDIGMIEGEVQHSDLELTPWRDDELVVFCSASHPFASKPKLYAKDIKEAAWILREPDSGARQTFDRAMSGLLSDINVYLEFKHNEAIKNAVESGLGIGCLSKIVLKNNFLAGDLVPLELPNRDLRRKFYFVSSKHRVQNDAVDSWMRIAIETDLRV